MSIDEKTIEAYDKLSREYDLEVEPFWTEFPQTILARATELMKGSVLDVGSGSGRDGVILRNAGLRVTCLDASDAMAALCKEKGLETVKGDLCHIPFEDKFFDNVWSYTSLLHLRKSEVPAALSEIKRVLKNRGIFVLGLIEGEGEEYKVSAGVEMERWFSFYKKEELEKLLTVNGFEIVYFEQFKPRSKNYLNFICRKV